MRKLEIPSSHRQITGTLYPAKGNTIVIAAHGFLSSQESDIITSCCIALQDAGITAFKADFPSKEEEKVWQQMHPSQMEEELEDMAAYFGESYDKVILLGHSLGGVLALRAAARLNPAGVIALATPSDTRDIEDMFREEQLKEIAGKGSTLWHREDKGISFIVTRQVIDELKRLDALASARGIECPALIVAAGEDSAVRREETENIFFAIPKKKDYLLIGGAHHNFWNHLEEVSRAVVNWVREV